MAEKLPPPSGWDTWLDYAAEEMGTRMLFLENCDNEHWPGKDVQPEDMKDAAREELRELRAEIEALRATLDTVQANLLKQARLYQADDGSPGPLSDRWGWRETSEVLRRAAKTAGGE